MKKIHIRDIYIKITIYIFSIISKQREVGWYLNKNHSAIDYYFLHSILNVVLILFKLINK